MFKEIKNVLIQDGTFNLYSNDHENPIQHTQRKDILKTFGENYVSRATHDNNDIVEAPKCHPGTRVSFLSHLSDWVMDAESPVYVTWLHGPAGGGKSAIARSLAKHLYNDSLLAGSFFFFKTDSSRNTDKPLVATLAYQISRSIPDTLRYIAKTVQDDPAICSSSLLTQFEMLIITPLACVMPSEPNALLRPMLIIIDGLDECVNCTARNLILEMVFNASPLLHGHIKFLIVSRPEYDIQRSFDSAGLEQHINTIELQGDLQAYEDVRIYLRGNFHRIKQTHPLRKHFASNWPTDDEIEQLVKKSSGHFIYASTVIKFIENDFDQPQKRLDIILRTRTTSHNPYAALDMLYLDILTSSRAERALLIKILSVFVLADKFYDQLGYQWITRLKSAYLMEYILFLEPGEVQLALLDLKSLVGVEEEMEFWHKSFSDFLLDSSRSKEFYACSADAYTVMAKGCLRLLSDRDGILDSHNRRRECHHLLSFCCKNAAADVDLQFAMVKYASDSDFSDVIPPSSLRNSDCAGYFWFLCSCLCNHQQASAFEGIKVVAYLICQFDRYLISELRRCVPLDSLTMIALRAAISPRCIDWKTYTAFALRDLRLASPKYQSCFLHYMYYEGTPNLDVVLCDFFYSRDRACEYYLGKLEHSTLSANSLAPAPVSTVVVDTTHPAEPLPNLKSDVNVLRPTPSPSPSQPQMSGPTRKRRWRLC